MLREEMELRPVWSSRIRFFLTYLKTVNIVSAAMSQMVLS